MQIVMQEMLTAKKRKKPMLMECTAFTNASKIVQTQGRRQTPKMRQWRTADERFSQSSLACTVMRADEMPMSREVHNILG
jgi:hypothetical protein